MFKKIFDFFKKNKNSNSDDEVIFINVESYLAKSNNAESESQTELNAESKKSITPAPAQAQGAGVENAALALESSPEPMATVENAAPALESSPEPEPTTPTPAQAQGVGVEKSTVNEQKSFTDSFRFDDSSVLETTNQTPKTSGTKPTAPAQSQEPQAAEPKLTPPKKAEKTKKATRKKIATKKSELSAPQAEQKADAVAEPTTPAQAQAPGADVGTDDEKEKAIKEIIAEIMAKNPKIDYETAKICASGIYHSQKNEKTEQAEQAKQAKQAEQAATQAKRAVTTRRKGYLKIYNTTNQQFVKTPTAFTIRNNVFTSKPERALPLIENKICYCEKGLEITQTSGKELNHFDNHILNVLLRIGFSKEKDTDLFGEESFLTTSAEMLRVTGRTESDTRTYKKIERSIRRIGNSVFIYKQTDGNKTILSNEQILRWTNGKITGESNESWRIHFNPKLALLYSNGSTYVDLKTQAKLLKSPIAYNLFHYFLSQKNGIQERFLETLQDACGVLDYYTPIEFKKSLKRALPLIAKEFELMGGFFDYGKGKNKNLGIFATGQRDNNGHKIEKLVFFKHGKYNPKSLKSLAEQEQERIAEQKEATM